jgi:hypothetical protein
MKRKIFIFLVFFALFAKNAYCLDTRLYDLRQKLFTQAAEIKKLLNRDNAGQYLVLVSGMWDSCFVAITQLDAYFYLLGLFNSIKKEQVTGPTIDFLSRWLKQIQQTSELNIKGLDAIKLPIEPMIRINMEKLKRYFRELNSQINKELAEIGKLRKSLDKALEPALGPR